MCNFIEFSWDKILVVCGKEQLYDGPLNLELLAVPYGPFEATYVKGFIFLTSVLWLLFWILLVYDYARIINIKPIVFIHTLLVIAKCVFFKSVLFVAQVVGKNILAFFRLVGPMERVSLGLLTYVYHCVTFTDPWEWRSLNIDNILIVILFIMIVSFIIKKITNKNLFFIFTIKAITMDLMLLASYDPSTMLKEKDGFFDTLFFNCWYKPTYSEAFEYLKIQCQINGHPIRHAYDIIEGVVSKMDPKTGRFFMSTLTDAYQEHQFKDFWYYMQGEWLTPNMVSCLQILLLSTTFVFCFELLSWFLRGHMWLPNERVIEMERFARERLLPLNHHFGLQAEQLQRDIMAWDPVHRADRWPFVWGLQAEQIDLNDLAWNNPVNRPDRWPFHFWRVDERLLFELNDVLRDADPFMADLMPFDVNGIFNIF